MLISMKLENWMSFRDEVTFSMVASREQHHKEHLFKTGKADLKLLPIAAIFGANASGKSNFIKGLQFVVDLIRGEFNGDKKLPVKPYKLDDDYQTNPSRFVLELLIENKIYEFEIACTADEIVYEKLTEVKASSEKVLYEIKHDQALQDFSFDPGDVPSLKIRKAGQKAPSAHNAKQQYLHMMVLTKSKTDMFFSLAASRNIKTIDELHGDIDFTFVTLQEDTFRRVFLKIFGHNYAHNMLKELDTGIVDSSMVEVVDNQPEQFKDFKRAVESQLDNIADGASMELMPGQFAVKVDGELVLQKTQTYHMGPKGTKIPFELEEESDGSQQLVKMAPYLTYMIDNEIIVKDTPRVLIIDEFDRSLHSLLTKQLVTLYLQSCGTDTRKQMIFSAHDLSLLDTKLLRRDEIWFAERESDGNSLLKSLIEFDARKDSDLAKRYLDGRFGGVPRLLLDLEDSQTQEVEGKAKPKRAKKGGLNGKQAG